MFPPGSVVGFFMSRPDPQPREPAQEHNSNYPATLLRPSGRGVTGAAPSACSWSECKDFQGTYNMFYAAKASLMDSEGLTEGRYQRVSQTVAEGYTSQGPIPSQPSTHVITGLPACVKHFSSHFLVHTAHKWQILSPPALQSSATVRNKRKGCGTKHSMPWIQQPFVAGSHD